jgi:FkbH-like protein
MRLIEALRVMQERPPGGPAFRLLIATGFTPLHLLTFLGAYLTLRLPAQRAEPRTGLYGDLTGTLRQATAERFDAAAVVVEWPDLDPRLSIRHLGGWEPERLPEIVAETRQRMGKITAAVAGAAARMPVAVSLPSLPLPPAAYHPSAQQSPLAAALAEMVAHAAGEMVDIEGVSVLSAAALDQVSPAAGRHDVKSEIESGFPYRTAHADALAELLAGLLAPPAPKKGLITDLDDTLWRGILGEDGVDDIAWDLDHHSQMHGYYQQILRSLAHCGVLVGVVLKNDPAIVARALSRADLLIQKSDLFPVEAGWGPKSEAVGRVLRAWNVAANSVIFIDDSPLELEEVVRVHPGIETIRFPAHDPEAIYRLGSQLRDLFGKAVVREEDRIRSQSLRTSAHLREAATEAADSEGFLRAAEAKLELKWVRPPLDGRIPELINKTNQFNINGRRYSEAEWTAYTAQPDTAVLQAVYGDKYGPLGKIAAIAGTRRGRRFEIATWVLSCRAFSRRIEHHMLKEVFERWDAAEVLVDFRRTERNGPAAEFLAVFRDASGEGAVLVSRERFAAICPALYHARTDAVPQAAQ